MKVSGRRINHWYKNFLSGFEAYQEEKIKTPKKNLDTSDSDVQETIYLKKRVPDIEKILEKNRGVEKKNQEIIYKTEYKKITRNKKVRVPICVLENFGPNMCIDDKNLGEYGFTILSNLDTGKIAFMIETRKSGIINEALKKNVPEHIRLKVKILTKDLAQNYESVREFSFPHSTGVADKFHVVKLGIQSISDLRVYYRQEEMTKERMRKEAHKCNEARNRDSAQQFGKEYTTKKCPPPQRMRNGETLLQVLSLTNRALSQFQVKWGKDMKERVEILFENFPRIKEIYKYISAFRGIYNAKEFGENSFKKARISLEKWFKSVGASEITEIQNFSHTVKHHRKEILSYFKTGNTNAYAESLNAKLQRFLRDNFGIKNLDFFLWRISKIFS